MSSGQAYHCGDYSFVGLNWSPAEKLMNRWVRRRGTSWSERKEEKLSEGMEEDE